MMAKTLFERMSEAQSPSDTPTAQPNERDKAVAFEMLFELSNDDALVRLATYRAEIEAAARADERAKRDAAEQRGREQGQREGKAAVCQWLRDRGAKKPPDVLFHAAAQLADQFEQSETPAMLAEKDRRDDR